MKYFVIIAVALTALLTVTTVAEAAPTTRGAKIAVKRKLRQGPQYDRVLYPYVRCYREARTRFYCEWSGLSNRDVATGNVDGSYGVATVTYYAGRYIARVY